MMRPANAQPAMGAAISCFLALVFLALVAATARSQGQAPETTVCRGTSSEVVLLVDPTLTDSIRRGLDQFEADLCRDGYTAIERISNFTSPPEVRNYLAGLYARTTRLEGAILIGNIPHAYQWVVLKSTNPNLPDVQEEAISLQYYSDLDGTFATSPGYVSPGHRPYSYDIHTGNVNWEIWTSVLPYYKGSISQTAAAMSRYFAKNHAYRTGRYTIPRGFLQINELQSASTQTGQDEFIGLMKNGIYSWTPWSNASNARLYVNGPTMSVSSGYADLKAGVADFTDTDTHGYWGASGQINIPWVESNPVKTVFFWSSGCAIGNIDRVDNFLSSILYSQTSTVLVGKGTTNDSGGMGNNRDGFYGHNVATALSQGKNFGQAIIGHVNVELLWPWSTVREFLYGTVIIVGDPTLSQRAVNALPSPLPAPTGVTFTLDDNTVKLTWRGVTGAESYDLEAGSQSGLSDLAVVNTTSLGFTATAVGTGTYYVRVRARDSMGLSGPSAEVVIIVRGRCLGLGSPSTLMASVAKGTVTLNWAGVAGAASYVVEAGSSSGASNLGASDTGTTATSLTASSVDRGIYYVRVRARNACETSVPSHEIVVVVQ